MVTLTSWRLSDAAKGQMEAMGVDALEVFAVLNKPSTRRRSEYGGERLSGYGLVVVVKGSMVDEVFIEGANAGNWEELARQRAQLRMSLNMPALPKDVLEELKVPERPARSVDTNYFPRQPEPKVVEAPVNTVHIMDKIHPSLRDLVSEQVRGDYGRLIVHSPTNVEILPKN